MNHNIPGASLKNERMSFSRLKCYLTNKHTFYKRYILKEPLTELPMAMAVGSAVHKGIEYFLKNKDPHTPKDLLSFTLRPGQTIDYGKNGSLEEAISQVDKALEWFHQLDEDWCMVTSEEGWTVNFGEGMRIVGFTDTMEDSLQGTRVDDFKTVKSLSTSPSLAYYLQMVTYKMLADASGLDVKQARIIELKKIPLKDPTKEHLGNMTRIHVFEDIPEEDVRALQELFRLAYREIVHGEQHYLPNFFDTFSTFEDWEDWKQRILTTLP